VLRLFYKAITALGGDIFVPKRRDQRGDYNGPCCTSGKAAKVCCRRLTLEPATGVLRSSFGYTAQGFHKRIIIGDVRSRRKLRQVIIIEHSRTCFCEGTDICIMARSCVSSQFLKNLLTGYFSANNQDVLLSRITCAGGSSSLRHSVAGSIKRKNI